eukprot:TRINITY_DN61240_c0_g1_i1.p1 TRINITY_DN61240_c0_g1~~TRINITY_DN61240_c0_g1_i1.p1  ORF type:complete len:519 (+),score=77.48 TRINITY_DN61240_c0_g1_i1:51-1559(+)
MHAAHSRPNILLIFPDQHRGDWLGFRGSPGLRTPNIDRLARDGVAFLNAISPAPLCAPARSCFATVQKYDDQLVRCNQDDLACDAQTFYKDLRNSGYGVFACGKLDLLKASKDWGHDGRHGAGDSSRLLSIGFTDGVDNAGKHDLINAVQQSKPEPYSSFLLERGLLNAHVDDFAARRGEQRYLNVSPTPLADDAYCDNWIGETGLSLLKQSPENCPWFLQVNFNGPHHPLDVTTTMLDAVSEISEGGFGSPIENSTYSPTQHAEIRRNYAAMVGNVDTWVGRYLRYLEATGQLNRTLVIYASDHGDQLGDFNKWDKQMPESGSLRVPLIFSGFGVQHQLPVRTPVDLVDVARTILDFAGVTPERLLGGHSLRDALEGRRLDWAERTAGLGSWRALIGVRYKYVHNYEREKSIQQVMSEPWVGTHEDAPAALFDLETDPLEVVNLVTFEKQLAAELRQRLHDALGEGCAPAPPARRVGGIRGGGSVGKACSGKRDGCANEIV